MSMKMNAKAQNKIIVGCIIKAAMDNRKYAEQTSSPVAKSEYLAAQRAYITAAKIAARVSQLCEKRA